MRVDAVMDENGFQCEFHTAEVEEDTRIHDEASIIIAAHKLECGITGIAVARRYDPERVG